MSNSGIDVRPIRIHDLFRLRSMRADAISPERSKNAISQRWADPWSALPFSRRESRSFVAFADGEPVGLLDLAADPANHRWVISRIATSRRIAPDAEHERELVWQELVLQAIRGAGAARAKRIHAILPDNSPVIDSLVAVGFNAYAQDSILMLARALPESDLAGVARRQEPSDLWAVHQLYHSVTPRPVQYAEALTSNYWGRASAGKSPPKSYVVEDGLEIVAHCRVVTNDGTIALHPMVQPGGLELLEPLLRDVLADCKPRRKSQVTVVVPDYLQEYVARLESLGFVEQARQTRLVKYTVVARRIQFQGVDEFAREVQERVAAGTPLSYLSTDGRRTARRAFDGRNEAIKDSNGFS